MAEMLDFAAEHDSCWRVSSDRDESVWPKNVRQREGSRLRTPEGFMPDDEEVQRAR